MKPDFASEALWSWELVFVGVIIQLSQLSVSMSVSNEVVLTTVKEGTALKFQVNMPESIKLEEKGIDGKLFSVEHGRNCVEIHAKEDCTGDFVTVKPGVPATNELYRWNLNNKRKWIEIEGGTKPVSPCTPKCHENNVEHFEPDPITKVVLYSDTNFTECTDSAFVHFQIESKSDAKALIAPPLQLGQTRHVLLLEANTRRRCEWRFKKDFRAEADSYGGRQMNPAMCMRSELPEEWEGLEKKSSEMNRNRNTDNMTSTYLNGFKQPKVLLAATSKSDSFSATLRSHINEDNPKIIKHYDLFVIILELAFVILNAKICFKLYRKLSEKPSIMDWIGRTNGQSTPCIKPTHRFVKNKTYNRIPNITPLKLWLNLVTLLCVFCVCWTPIQGALSQTDNYAPGEQTELPNMTRDACLIEASQHMSCGGHFSVNYHTNPDCGPDEKTQLNLTLGFCFRGLKGFPYKNHSDSIPEAIQYMRGVKYYLYEKNGCKGRRLEIGTLQHAKDFHKAGLDFVPLSILPFADGDDMINLHLVIQISCDEQHMQQLCTWELVVCILAGILIGLIIATVIKYFEKIKGIVSLTWSNVFQFFVPNFSNS